MDTKMVQGMKVLGFVVGMAAAGAAFAQTTDTTEAASDADASTEVEVTLKPGDAFVAGTFTDWELRCIRLESGADRCQMYQLLVDQTDNAVAEISVFAIPPGGPAEAGASVVTPLETLLTENLRLSVDGDAARIYPFSFCTEEGCISRLGFTPEEVSTLKRGAAAKLTIVPAVAPDQTVDLTMSLSGFTAAYTEMLARAEAPN